MECEVRGQFQHRHGPSPGPGLIYLTPFLLWVGNTKRSVTAVFSLVPAGYPLPKASNDS